MYGLLRIYISSFFFEKDDSTISIDDLKLNEDYLVFIYYKDKTFNCGACEYYKEYLKNVKVKVKYLNFATNKLLAIRFHQYKFPAFILKKDNQYFVLNPIDGNDLIKKIDDSNGFSILKYPPTSLYSIILSYFNVIIYTMMGLFYKSLNFIPEWLLVLIILFIVIYLTVSILEVLFKM
ncbi:hypothetical protein A0H76_2054 [Hepatospora eriocheir]|uniref:Thioredoxin domain-containing protein n=1 Tax=Hepatospora eriocheir TaxID=1081669 RepID=A0A1X0QKB6_9MICR|nr:hypothetical protein A0H76_2054 [Hepatospora eriocheir]